MWKVSLSIFLCFLCFVFVDSTNKSYDRYKFVLQWPKTVSTVPNDTIPNRFTIHGLWPQNTKGGKLIPNNYSFPTCNNGIVVGWPRSLVQNLHTNWPDIVYKNDCTFWLHEWKYHGKYQEKGAYSYFSGALIYYYKFSVSKLVAALGGAKNPLLIGHPYELAIVEAAFKETLGSGKYDVPIKCSGNELMEVAVFIDPDTGGQLPSPDTTTCPAGVNITIPSP